MAIKLLLCISAEQATIARWRGRRISDCRCFDNDEAGRVAFNNYLRSCRGLPVDIVVDTVDEDYRFETLPHVRGNDRGQMIGRKLKQVYRNTPYCAASLQERDAGKRRDDRFLFAALTDPELLSPWLKMIELNGLSVAGIHPLPMVTVSLIERLKLKHANLLIVTKNSAGFRQTFFKNLKFRISRLTPLRGSTAAADQQYAEEVSNTRMYLDALTVTHVDDALTVVVIDQDDSLAGLPAAIARGRPNIQSHRLGKVDVISRFGIDASDLDTSVDTLHLQLLGEHTPALNLAPKVVMGGFRIYQARRVVYGLSIATGLVAAGWGGVNAYQAMRMETEIKHLQQQTQDYQTRYQQVTAQFPQTPTSVENLRNTVEIAQEIRAGLRTPEPMLQLVSRALDASPKVRLNRLEWHYGDKPAGLEIASPNGASTGTAQIGVIHADIRSDNTDYRAALSAINDFAAKLAANDMVNEVKALQLPLDMSPSAGLSGSTAAKDNASTQFRLAVVFKPGG